jgi:type IV pilus assembly protein PilV
MFINNRHQQSGVGLVEVLVAMLVLAVGVMGFAALQVRAVGATSESLSRTQAMTILRSLGERIRANNTATTYPTLIKAASLTTPNKICAGTTYCTAAEMATYDAYIVETFANENGIKLSMDPCPSLQTGFSRQCIYAAWNKTKPSSGADADLDCVDLTGVYHNKSSCLVLEVY